MALSSSRLATAIRANLSGYAWWNDAAPEAEEFAAAIADAVITEITANGVVVPTLLVAPPSGGPVTGTGTIA